MLDKAEVSAVTHDGVVDGSCLELLVLPNSELLEFDVADPLVFELLLAVAEKAGGAKWVPGLLFIHWLSAALETLLIGLTTESPKNPASTVGAKRGGVRKRPPFV